jgi:DNA-binding CsgD family transcriptional regulator
MKSDLKKLQNVWEFNRGHIHTSLPNISFDDLANSIISTGPFYYYIIDFYDMSISNVSSSIFDIHGFDTDTVTFNDILGVLHSDDLDFIMQAEKSVADFFYNKIGGEKLLRYKVNYCFRAMLSSGDYAMFNHQAIMLTLDDSGKFGKSLNIHTRIDHLTNVNTYNFSLISLQGEVSYMNVNVAGKSTKVIRFSKREKEILKFIAMGLNSYEIGQALFISEETVKRHRKNILTKADCKNTAQLIKLSVLQGLT